MILLTSLLLALLTAIPVSAAPYSKRWPPPGGWIGSGGPSGHGGWSDRLPFGGRGPWSGAGGHDGEDSSGDRSDHQDIKRSYLHFEKKAVSTATCDIQNAIQYMDLSAVNPPLPSPSGMSLFQVALGRGTQNYTCDLANATATPVPAGALATLFDFSCVAAQKPALLKRLPRIAINQQLPTPNNTDPSVLDDLTSGYHYFLDSTTPFFNLDTSLHQYGMGALAKVNASDAPAGSCAGQYGQPSYGAVQWLRLDQTSTYNQRDWKAVYRLNTAGGNPPKTCNGEQPAFEIPYAAEYWIFK